MNVLYKNLFQIEFYVDIFFGPFKCNTIHGQSTVINHFVDLIICIGLKSKVHFILNTLSVY